MRTVAASVALQDLCLRVTSGGTPSRSVAEYFDGGTIPWMKTGEVKQRFVYSTEEHITERGLENSSAKIIPPNSIVIAMYGDGETAGNVAVNKVALATNQACCNFVIDPARADYLFLYYYLKGSYNNLVNLKLGGSQQNLNAATLKRFPVPRFSLEAQKKIAAILFSFDNLIENNRKRIALLERMAEQLYREWFVRFRFPGHENAGFEKGVPASWVPKPSSDLFEVMSGGTPNTDTASFWGGEIPFFTPKDAPENTYVLSTEKTLTASGLEACNSRLYPRDTIFITARGTVGKLALAHVDMAMNQSCYALAPKRAGAVYFHFLALKLAVSWIKGVSNSGVFDNIVVDTFKVVPILLPPDDLVRQFNERATPIFDQIAALLSANVVLAKSRDLLLPRLISGKLRVDDLDIQFPPSMQDAAA